MDILYNLIIQYKDKPIKKIDDKIKKEEKKRGYKFYASGYNFRSGWRDLCFDKVEIVEDKDV